MQQPLYGSWGAGLAVHAVETMQCAETSRRGRQAVPNYLIYFASLIMQCVSILVSEDTRSAVPVVGA